MPLSTITATLDNTLRCTIDELCTQQTTNLTQDASISFTTFLTAGSTLLATIYAAASSSITLSSIKLYSFYSKQRPIDQLIQSSEFNLSSYDNCTNHFEYRTAANTSPTQSEIVSITGALIIFTVLLTTVLLTHLFDAIDDFTRKCCKIKFTNLLHIGLGKNVRQLLNTINQLILDLIITIVLKSTILTSLFVDEKSLKLKKKLNFDSNEDHNRNFDQNTENDRLEELLSSDDEDDEFYSEQTNWSGWFAEQLRKRLIHS